MVVYRRRMLEMPLEELQALEGAWLSTFHVYSTVAADPDGQIVVPQSMTLAAPFVLATVCHERGVRVRGVTSERKRRGEYICATLPDGPRAACRVVYVDGYNYFTGHHLPSPFSVTAADRVYAA